MLSNILLHREPPPCTIEESLTRAMRLISPVTGIITAVDHAELTPDDPDVHVVHSVPADTRPWFRQRALNAGTAASWNPRRAVMKAIGESVERYCSACYDEDALLLAGYRDLTEPAVDPRRFALYSKRQYAAPDCPFTPLSEGTSLCWVAGHSFTTGRRTLIPATMVYIPYRRRPDEPRVTDLISTGLACGPSYAHAVYRGAMECIERDAFSLVWHNRSACRHVDLSLAARRDPAAARMIDAIEAVRMRCQVLLLTQDLPVPVLLVLLTSRTGRPPLTVIGLGADLSAQRALILALEEACLGLYGMDRRAADRPDFRPVPPYSQITTMGDHGLAHALLPELLTATDFLRTPSETVDLADLPTPAAAGPSAHLRRTVALLADRGFEVLAVDLTTPDIDEVGFKVVRTLIPGLQPLDNDHRWRLLGGARLYREPGVTDDDLNPFPHPFP